ncbi:MAG: response regulator transcription factor [Thermoguttaceae bacterium]|nr:response regulator transcription factor [Thermoguttaceae bacterium]
MFKEKILVVEDDESIREMLGILLESRGYTQVTLVASGEEALESAEKSPFALVLLDLTLPGIDGLEVCQRLQKIPQNAHSPIVMLTARGAESDIVVGLEMGAVDYIVKPFNNQTLIARIRAHLRRTRELTAGGNYTEPEDVVRRDGFTIRPAERSVDLQGKEIDLTFTEYELLIFLLQSPGRVWSRSEIAIALRGDDYMSFDRAIDVQVAKLRKKLGTAGGLIETIRGIGYRWKRS